MNTYENRYSGVMSGIKWVIVFLLVLKITDVFAQIRQTIGYRGNLVLEYFYSVNKDKYVPIDELQIPTKIVVKENAIFFKKGASSWLRNYWTFETRNTYLDTEYDIYLDERFQRVCVNTQGGEILYFYDWDIHIQKFTRLSIYANLIKDDDVINEVLSNSEHKSLYQYDYKYISFYDKEKDKWTEWEKEDNTFFFNNSENQIIHLKSDGTRVTYYNISLIQSEHYYLFYKGFTATNYPVFFQFFTELQMVKFIYGDTFISFANIPE